MRSEQSTSFCTFWPTTASFIIACVNLVTMRLWSAVACEKPFSWGSAMSLGPRTDERLPLASRARVTRNLIVGEEAELAQEGRLDLADVGAVTGAEDTLKEGLQSAM